MSGPHLALSGVTLRFGALVALEDATLRIEPGECVGIVGPSGAGKTSLLRLFLASLRPSAGQVHVAGRNLADLSPQELRAHRASIGTVHQDLRLIPTQRVLSNVLGGRLGRWSLPRAARELLWPRRREQERVYEILGRVGIPEKLFERVETLSGGQQQRVAIARALYQEPRILLADEPLAGIDPARARDTLGLLVELAAEAGLTLCVSLHDLALAREFLPRLIGLRAGRVVFDAASDSLGDADFAALYSFDEGSRPPP